MGGWGFWEKSQGKSQVSGMEGGHLGAYNEGISVFEAPLCCSNERLNIQMDNDQITHKSRTLTHSVQQAAQETNPLSTVTSPEAKQ